MCQNGPGSNQKIVKLHVKEIELLKEKVYELRKQIDRARESLVMESHRRRSALIKLREHSMVARKNTVEIQSHVVDLRLALKFASTALSEQNIQVRKLLTENDSLHLQIAKLARELRQLECEISLKQRVEEGLREDTEALGEALAEKTDEQLEAQLTLINDLSQVRERLAQCQITSTCRELLLELILDCYYTK